MRLIYFTAAMSYCSTEALMTIHTQILRSPKPLPLRMHAVFCRDTSYRHDTQRLYSQKGSGDSDPGMLTKVKSILPKKWFGTDDEKAKIQKRKELKKQVSSGLDEMFKDAPLGFRMVGKMIGPLMSTVASTMAETMAEQQRTTASVLEDARYYLESDPVVSEILGRPLQLGAPFSQASSSTSINGNQQSRVELALPVNGRRSSGVARILATQDGIAQLQVEAGGSVINVRLTNSRQLNNQAIPRPDDDIIEAEIVDKNTKY